MSRLSLMPHAVERYRERWAPHLTLRQAREELHRLSEGARPEKAKTRGGQELWVANDATRKILFVVKRDRHTRERICVTVLPEGAMGDSGATAYEEFLAYSEEREEMLRETALMRARTDGNVCQPCNNAVATRFSIGLRQRICDGCYKTHKAKAGRSPLLTEWLKKSEAERRELLGNAPPKAPAPKEPDPVAASVHDRPEKRASDVFRQLYAGCSWFVDVQPSEMSGGKKFLLVSTTRMLESHESRFLRDFMSLPVRLDVLGESEARARQAKLKTESECPWCEDTGFILETGVMCRACGGPKGSAV